jgi:hypothetical protein
LKINHSTIVCKALLAFFCGLIGVPTLCLVKKKAVIF